MTLDSDFSYLEFSFAAVREAQLGADRGCSTKLSTSQAEKRPEKPTQKPFEPALSPETHFICWVGNGPGAQGWFTLG